jgi:hypothetical protein
MAWIVSGAFFLHASGIATAGWDFGMESSAIETSEFETEEGAGTGNIVPESGIVPEEGLTPAPEESMGASEFESYEGLTPAHEESIGASEFETEEGAGTGNILPESGIAPEGSFREEGSTVESFP